MSSGKQNHACIYHVINYYIERNKLLKLNYMYTKYNMITWHRYTIINICMHILHYKKIKCL